MTVPIGSSTEVHVLAGWNESATIAEERQRTVSAARSAGRMRNRRIEKVAVDYPNALSKVIMTAKPAMNPSVAMSVVPLRTVSGMSSSTTT